MSNRYEDNSEGVILVFFVCVVLCFFSFVMGGLLARSVAEERMQIEAVEAGYAKWAVSTKGIITFEWLEKDKE